MPFCNQEAVLAEHNKLRALHGAPPLQWSTECALYAQKCASENQANGRIHHCFVETTTSSRRMGQCIYWAEETGEGPETAIRVWYGEKDDPGYDDSNPGYQPGTGQFSQIVWYNTTHVGLSKSSDGLLFVANYYPAGNRVGAKHFGKNVLPLNSELVIRPRNKVEIGLFAQFEVLAKGRDKVPVEELAQLFSDLGKINLADAACKCDLDGDGLVDPQEFCMVMAQPKDADGEEHFDRVVGFVQADTDGDMKVDVHELALFFKSKARHKFKQEQVQAILARFDTDNDGTLDYGEMDLLIKSGLIEEIEQGATAAQVLDKVETSKSADSKTTTGSKTRADSKGKSASKTVPDSNTPVLIKSWDSDAEARFAGLPAAAQDVIERIKECCTHGGTVEFRQTETSIDAELFVAKKRFQVSARWD